MHEILNAVDMYIKTIPSNDNDYEKTFTDFLRSTSKPPIFFNRYLQKTTPQIKYSYYHLHTNFEYLLFWGVSYKEVHTKGPHPHPLPKWIFILDNYGYKNVMSVVFILWPICRSEGSSKIFHSMNYILLCLLPCKYCTCHISPGPGRLVGSMPIKQKSFQNP